MQQPSFKVNYLRKLSKIWIQIYLPVLILSAHVLVVTSQQQPQKTTAAYAATTKSVTAAATITDQFTAIVTETRLWTVTPNPTYRIDGSRVSFVASRSNRKHSSSPKRMPSKLSFAPIILPSWPILLLNPELSSRWKCSIDTVPIRSSIQSVEEVM
ncbi:uncharacterized protein LOC115264740 isoform X1 [Aedes albopictus]|uniref:Secreted protein n=1 Tax=Aedes albopictus TaxID=7160 RepID=A0ABM1YTY1_AEDAL